MKKLIVFLCTCLYPAAVMAWSCPQEADVDGDGWPEQVAGNEVGDLVLPLPAPSIERVCLGDLDGDGKSEVVIGVVRSTAKDPTFRQRLFVFHATGRLVPAFLGTSGSGILLSFGLQDLDGDGKVEVLARERDAAGEKTRVYAWGGYDLVEKSDLASKAPTWHPEEAAAGVPRFADMLDETSGKKPKQISFERRKGAIRPVRIGKGFSNVVNRGKFRWLKGKARSHLRRNGFVVMRPRDPPFEFHSLYIQNVYDGLPSLVTADAALHLSHLLFDQAMQKSEEFCFAPALKRLVDSLRSQAKRLQGRIPGAAKALETLLTRLELAAFLMDGDEGALDPARAERVKQEAGCILGASGPGGNPLGIDYPAYVVRGHYTSSEALGRYFRAFLFLSQAGTQDPVEAALWAGLVASDPENVRLLGALEGFSGMLVGPAAGPGVMDLIEGAHARWGENSGWEKILGDTGWVRDGLPACRAAVLAGSCPVTLLSRRWSPDNDLLTVGVDVNRRPFPDPLDWMAAMGSGRARDLLAGAIEKWPELGKRLDQARSEVLSGGLLQTGSIAGRWLASLRWLLLPYPKGYASFQQNFAWQAHNLVSAGASWAELRRDTILYVQPPVVWMEGGEEDYLPPSKAGFVEPVPELYAELADMLAEYREELAGFTGESDWSSARVPGPLSILEKGVVLLRFLEEMASKQLDGKGLTRDEHEQLSNIGGWFEDILSEGGKVKPDPVPVIADVYYFGDPETGEKKPLLVATGPVDILVAAVPLGKRVILARGAVYSFYHFEGDGPMNDKQWRDILDGPGAPLPPGWARPIELKRSMGRPGKRRARD